MSRVRMEPAVVNGEPVMLTNIAGLVELVKGSTLGVDDALAALKEKLPAAVYDQVAAGGAS